MCHSEPCIKCKNCNQCLVKCYSNNICMDRPLFFEIIPSYESIFLQDEPDFADIACKKKIDQEGKPAIVV